MISTGLIQDICTCRLDTEAKGSTRFEIFVIPRSNYLSCKFSISQCITDTQFQSFQREAEKLERQKLLADKMTKAVSHYHTAQLRWRGMAPWKKFVEGMKASYLEANRLREKALIREVWSRWQRMVEERERERTAIAAAHHHRALLKKGLMAWVKVRTIIYSSP